MFARSKRHRKVEEERPKRRTPLKHQYIDAVKFVDDYLDMRDWRVRENANVPYSFSSLFLQAAGETVARYTLSEVYPREIAKAHIEGDFHIHNLPFGIVGYCAGWSIEDLLLHGFSGVRGRTESSPPRHFSSALLQISNFLGSIQNEWAGAQAVNSLDVYLAPFVRKDKLSYKQVKQAMQEFIYNLNISSRWGGQTPFTNVTFELKVPEDMKKEPVIYGGKALDETYADYQSEADLINRAFLDVMLHGDMRGRIFTFPIPTFNITKDFDWDSEVSNLLFAVTAKFGIPYFQNCIKGGIDPREVRSMCCRLMLDLKELHRRYGGFFGYADKTGSIGVCTINMPRLGHVSKDESDFFERLEHLMELAKNSLEIKRKLVEQNMKRGLLPFSARYLGTLKFHFSTIGLVGMHEACLNFIGDGIQTKAGKDFAIKVLKFMRERLVEFQDETGNIYNLEATPAEGTSHHLARLDKKRYPKIITAGKKVPYYTNSTHLPVGYTNNLIEAIRHQDDLQVLYNGGTILHGFLGEAVSSAEGCKTLVRKIAENFRLPYYTITPTFCYDEKTEVLTRDGWKWFKNVKPSDEIATLNIETRELEYQKPIGIYKFRYNGKMVHFKNRNIDLLVTPDHRMLVSSRRSKNKKLYFKGAKDVTQTHNIPLLGIKWKGRDKEFFVLPKVSMPPNYGKLVLDSENCIEKKGHPWTKEEIDFMRKDYAHISPKQLQAVSHRTTDAIKQKAFQSGLKLQTLEIPEKKIPMNDWLRFFGIWLAEGWIKKHPKNGQYLVGISQSTKFYKEIRDLLKRLPSSFKYYDKLSSFVAVNKQLWEYLHQFGGSEKFVSTEIKQLPAEKLKILLDWYLKGDGSTYRDEAKSVSKRLLDDLQEIALKIGRRATIVSRGLQIDFTKSKRVCHVGRYKKEVPYEGFVYCVEVPNSTVYVRRNGKPVFCGNSICMNHGYLRGEHFKCPRCGKSAEVYSRIVGYYRPVQNWHVGKREEFRERLEYDEKVGTEEI